MSENKIPGMPEFKVNQAKNGYEIRSDVLAMAKDFLSQEYSARYMGWEVSQKRDHDTGQIVTAVGMPEFPGLDKVLETAQRMYDFVNQSNRK